MRWTIFAGWMTAAFAVQLAPGQAETVVLKQGFDEFPAELVGTEGSEQGEGGAWKEFGKRESSPRASDLEFFPGPQGAAGKSIRIIRDDAAVETPDFWLTGSWGEPLDSGKVRVSFRFLRDSADSGFSLHLGTEEKNAGVNTIAVSIGNRTSSLEKLGIMTSNAAWQITDRLLPVGTWTQIVLEIDFPAATYSVTVDGEPVGEPIPFAREGPLRRISFLPTHPDANVSYIDDVEVVVLD